MHFKMALYTISQRFEYHISAKIIFPFANIYLIALVRRSIIKPTALDYI